MLVITTAHFCWALSIHPSHFDSTLPFRLTQPSLVPLFVDRQVYFARCPTSPAMTSNTHVLATIGAYYWSWRHESNFNHVISCRVCIFLCCCFCCWHYCNDCRKQSTKEARSSVRDQERDREGQKRRCKSFKKEIKKVNKCCYCKQSAIARTTGSCSNRGSGSSQSS